MLMYNETSIECLQNCLSGVRDVRLPLLKPPVCVALLMSWWVLLNVILSSIHTIQFQTLRIHESFMVVMCLSRQEDYAFLQAASPPMWIRVSTMISWWVLFFHYRSLFGLLWCFLICIFCSFALAADQCPVCLVLQKPLLLVGSLPCNSIPYPIFHVVK